MAELRTYSGTVPLALEFTILTAVRTGDVLGARCSEIDMATATWTIPAERTKSRREHRIPLSDEAVTVLQEVKKFSDGGDIIFGGQRRERLSHRAMPALMRRMGRRASVVRVAELPHSEPVTEEYLLERPPRALARPLT
jgi:integrase